MEKLNETNTSLDTSSFGINLCSIDNDNRNMTGAVSQLLNFFIIGFGILVIVTTVFGNSLVILAIICDKKLRRVGNIFIISLAISDILVGSLVTPFALLNQVHKTWNFGILLCDFWISVDVICCTASILNLCIISYDRFNAITKPLKYARYRTVKRAFIVITCVWLYSIFIALPPLFGWRVPQERMGDWKCEITQEIGYTFYSTIGAFYLPLCVMVFFYVRIFCITSKRGKKWMRGPGSSRLVRHRNAPITSSSVGDDQRKVVCNFSCLCCTKRQELNENALPLREHRQSSNVSLLRQSTIEISQYSPQIQRESIFMSPRESTTSTKEIVLEITQGRRKQTIQKKLYRQISNVASDTSYSTSTTTTGCSTDSSMSENPDFRSQQRMTSVLNNLVAANIVQIAGLQESLRGIRYMAQTRLPSLPSGDGTDGDSAEQAQDEHTKTLPVPPSPTPRKVKPRRRNKNIALPQEKRAVKTLGIVVGCFIICWLPFFIVAIVKPLCHSCFFDSVVIGVVTWLGYFNSACNPVIYTFFNKDFRSAFRKIFTCYHPTSPSYV